MKRLLHTFKYDVHSNKIMEFANATQEDDEIYYNREIAIKHGYRDIPIPNTFGTAIEMWSGFDFPKLVEMLEVDPSQVLHGNQSFEYYDDICSNDVLYGEINLISTLTKGKLKFFNLETRFYNNEEKLILLACSTIIEKKSRESR